MESAKEEDESDIAGSEEPGTYNFFKDELIEAAKEAAKEATAAVERECEDELRRKKAPRAATAQQIIASPDMKAVAEEAQQGTQAEEVAKRKGDRDEFHEDDAETDALSQMFHEFRGQHAMYVKSCAYIMERMSRMVTDEKSLKTGECDEKSLETGETKQADKGGRHMENRVSEQPKKRRKKGTRRTKRTNVVAEMLRSVVVMEKEMQEQSRQVRAAMVTPGLEFTHSTEEWVVQSKDANGECQCKPLNDMAGSQRVIVLHSLQIAETFELT